MTGIRIGGRVLRPGAASGIAAAAFIALTISLGNWQTRRAEEKLELGRRLDEATGGPVLAAPSVRLDASPLGRPRVTARGHFAAQPPLLLDHKVLKGVAANHVLTPQKLQGGELHFLANPGWHTVGPT